MLLTVPVFTRCRLVTFALLAAGLFAPANASAQDNPFSSCRANQSTRQQGVRPELIPDRPGARRWTLTGSVVVTCDDTTLWADQIQFEDDTNAIIATGNVVFQQADMSIYAERLEMDGRTKLGTFYRASGSARIAEDRSEMSQFGTMEPDVMFEGEEIAKTGPTTYRIRHGRFTTCVQPTPRWEMSGAEVTIVLDKYALLRNMVFRVKGVPLFGLPVLYYPIDKRDRSTGFLLPTYGTSTVRGASFSNAFFWAIDRSQDATFYHDWFTKTGQGLGAEYRYVAAPGSEGRANVYMVNEREPASDGSLGSPKRTYTLEGNANVNLPHGFRLYGRANYFNDITLQQAHQDIVDFSRRDRSMSATLTGTVRRLRMSFAGERRDYFDGPVQGQRTGRAPYAQLTLGEKPIGRTKIYFGISGEGGYVIRQNDVSVPETNRSLWRFDGAPTIRTPLSTLPYLSATASASFRVTRWMRSVDPATDAIVAVPITRRLLDTRVQVTGPVFARVFQTPGNRYAVRFKHLIEPSFTIQRTSAFRDLDRVVQIESIDRLVGGTTTVSYRLTNRLLARRAGGDEGAGVVREILSVDLQQSHYSNALAAVADPQFPSSVSTASNFSPLQLRVTSRPTDSATGDFTMDVDAEFRAIRTLGGNGTISTRLTETRIGWSKRRFIPGLRGFEEARASHYLNASFTARTPGNRMGGRYDFNYDVQTNTLRQQRVVAYLNSQCCGVSFDWQSVDTPLLNVKSDRRFGVSFTLAGIGSFSNPLGSFGGQ